MADPSALSSRESSAAESAHGLPQPPAHRILPQGDYGFGAGSDRRFSFSRQASFTSHYDPLSPLPTQRGQSLRPTSLSRSDSSIIIPPFGGDVHGKLHGRAPAKGDADGGHRLTPFHLIRLVSRAISSGNRPVKRLALLISLNVAYSTAELLIGIFTGRVGLVSDAFHLTFGCGLLTFSLFSMAASRKKPDDEYTYGYKRLEVLSAFTNASRPHIVGKRQLFLLFMSFSLAVEALHAFIQDESEHKHYLVISAVANLLVNLIGVWFFRSYARVNIVYRKAEDMNYHSVCLHVLSDSIRSAGLILASWLLSLGVENAEFLCMGLVSVAMFMVVLPLFRATANILLQTAPASIPASALNKCKRQISSLEDVCEVSDARFWELVPGHTIGSLLIQVKNGNDDYPILQYIHGLYHDLGVQDLTVQAEHV